MIPAFDAVSSAALGSTGSLSWSHSLGALGSNGVIVVGIETKNGGNNISGVTFNGIAMTPVVSDGAGVTYGTLFELHGIAVPPTGVYTIVATFSGWSGGAHGSAGGCISFKNIKNQNAEASALTNGGSTRPISQNITTISINALVVAIYGDADGDFNSMSGTIDFNVVPGSEKKIYVSDHTRFIQHREYN